MTGLPPEFTPYLIRGGSDEFGIIRGSLHFIIPIVYEDFECGMSLADMKPDGGNHLANGQKEEKARRRRT